MCAASRDKNRVVILLVCLVAYPFGMAVYFSLSDYWVGSPGAFIGLANYREILNNEVFLQTVRNSFVFTAIALGLSLLGFVLPVVSALAHSARKKRRLWGKGKCRCRTKGTYGSASVRGTQWLTEDEDGGTRVNPMIGDGERRACPVAGTTPQSR